MKKLLAILVSGFLATMALAQEPAVDAPVSGRQTADVKAGKAETKPDQPSANSQKKSNKNKGKRKKPRRIGRK